MTDLLDRAFQHASALPPQQQDAIAAWILAEMEDDARWDESFAKKPSVLAMLADEARAEPAAGQTRPLITISY